MNHEKENRGLLKIIPLNEAPIEAAAPLVVSRYANLRQQVQLLPQRYQEPANILSLLRNSIGAGGPGVADPGRPVGRFPEILTDAGFPWEEERLQSRMGELSGFFTYSIVFFGL